MPSSSRSATSVAFAARRSASAAKTLRRHSHGLASCGFSAANGGGADGPGGPRRAGMASSTKRTEQGVGAANAAPASSRARSKRKLPIRSSPVSTAPSLSAKLSGLKTPANAASRAPARAKSKKAPFARNPVLQELEPRLLMSADLNPLAHDTLLASPTLTGAEFRSLSDHGAPTVVTSAQVAPIQRTNELVFVDTATPDYQQLIDSMRTSALAEGRNLE